MKVRISRYLVMLLIIAASVMPSSLFAQGNKGPKKIDEKEWRDKIMSIRIAFLTDELDLTPEEAQRFWPVYNMAQEEFHKAMNAQIAAFFELDKAIGEEKSDNEISALFGKYIETLSAAKSLDEKYIPEYEKVLPARKVAKLYVSEEKFRMTQIRRLGGAGHHGGKGGNGTDFKASK